MKIALIEDELPALDHLEALLARVRPEAVVVARLRTVRETRAWIASGAPADVVLADVELGDGLSLDALSEGGLDRPVVFTTAFDHYVLPALSANGLAYLLKPVREDELRAAFDKLDRLERHFRQARPGLAPSRPERLVGRRGGDWVSLPMAQIAWLRVRHGATWAMDRGGTEVLLETSLSAVQQRLDPTRFHRANRWYVVSIDAIERVRSAGRGRLELVVSPAAPEAVVVPQEGAAAFRAWFAG